MINLIPDAAKLPLIIAAACIAVFASGCGLGYSYATAKGDAALASLKAEYAEEQRRASEAYGKALADTLERYTSEVNRGDALVVDLAAARAVYSKQEKSLRRQIADVTRSSTHVFSADFVRLYNESIRAIPDSPLPTALRAPGPQGKAGNRTAPHAGLLPAGGVTEADLLAHIAYYGARCQNLEAQIAAWIELAKGWK